MAGAHAPRQLTDSEVLGYLELVVARLERLGDRLAAYVDDDDSNDPKGTDDSPTPS